MSSSPVTLDFSTSMPLDVNKLDFSTAQSITPGEMINDVGNRVIVPAGTDSARFGYEGESFADTLKRAAAYGQSITQQPDKGAGVINKELATAPKKAATTLASATAIG